jgi:hypothetical protein
MPRVKQTRDPAPDPEATEQEAAAEEASEEAKAEAQTEAAERGIKLSSADLDRIGDRAAERTHQLFERSGAFRREEPEPPPKPEMQEEEVQVDEQPRKPPSWAQKICDT